MNIPWLSSKKSSSSSINPDIHLIGDRGSGKTAYLASLAYLSQFTNPNLDSPIESITTFGDQEASQELINYAKDILEKGLELESTKLIDDPHAKDVRIYGFNITLKSHLSKNPNSERVKLPVTCKDYSGEFFEDLIYNMGNPYLDNYIEDCKSAGGILLLIDGTSNSNDANYAQGLANFFKGLDHLGDVSQKRRIAFTLGKCDLPGLWVNRNNPGEIIEKIENRFPKTMNQLKIWEDNESREVDYFVTSSFGLLGEKYPEPNTKIIERDKNGSYCIIRKPKLWRSFGLVSPIYWLCTGERHKSLDES
ncbi:hypothetical protein [Crocosphaera watsonii]|uniref:Uncharacterized protein n=1 Tax=Crocosphaera watsonii WH 0401 TaxID=555881 RepID=T2J3H1_CROWT|nr:hypothetical protein [Crocosphaera watsonii]CCQ59706.1 hypothetical protein CWATWH0401_567 [Crocosphaera watsonii WH 0401]